LSVLVEVGVGVLGEQVHDGLVGRHHDGRVGDLAHELGGEAAVEAADALLVPHHGQRLPEAAVLGALLAQPCASHLVRVGDARGHRLGHGASHHELEEVPRALRVVVACLAAPPCDQLRFNRLVDHKVYHRLRDAKVGRCDALVKAPEALETEKKLNNNYFAPYKLS